MGTLTTLDPTRRPRRPTAATGSGEVGEPAIYTVRQTAELLSLSVGLTYQLVRDGTLLARRCGRRWIIPRVALLGWLEAQQEGSR